jgi:predicted lactoylglutathione lyase
VVIDHLMLRVPDLESATERLKAALHELGVTQTRSSRALSSWGNFVLAEARPGRPIGRGIDVAFLAPTPEHVDRFASEGISAGLADAGARGHPTTHEGPYYATSLRDGAGNCFQAVHRDSARPTGTISGVTIRVADVSNSTAFYRAIGPHVGLTVQRQLDDRTTFAVASSGGAFSVIAGVPSQNLHLAFSGGDGDVRGFHADAVAAGYDSNGEPGERPQYHDGYYAAFVLDPDGNNIEVVAHRR